MGFGRRMPEVAEADVVQRGRGLETGDVAAQFRAVLVGAQDDGHRVPADDGAQPMLDRTIAGRALFLLRRDGVLVGRVQRLRRVRPFTLCLFYYTGDEVAGSRDSAMRLNRAQGIHPLAGLEWVEVIVSVHRVSTYCFASVIGAAHCSVNNAMAMPSAAAKKGVNQVID